MPVISDIVTPDCLQCQAISLLSLLSLLQSFLLFSITSFLTDVNLSRVMSYTNKQQLRIKPGVNTAVDLLIRPIFRKWSFLKMHSLALNDSLLKVLLCRSGCSLIVGYRKLDSGATVPPFEFNYGYCSLGCFKSCFFMNHSGWYTVIYTFSLMISKKTVVMKNWNKIFWCHSALLIRIAEYKYKINASTL